MAAVIDMGEVDEIHSKEETIKDGIILNGDTSSVKSNEEEEEEEEENDAGASEEVMEVDEAQDSEENDVEATSIEIDDDDDEDDSNQTGANSNAELNEKDDAEVEIHSIDNSDDDEVNEIHDDEINEIQDDEVNEIVDDEVNEIQDDEINEIADDEVNEIHDDEINEIQDDEVNEIVDDEVNEIQDDEINEIADDEVNEIVDDEVNEVADEEVNEIVDDENTKIKSDEINEIKDDQVNEVAHGEVNEITSADINEVKDDNKDKTDSETEKKKDVHIISEEKDDVKNKDKNDKIEEKKQDTIVLNDSGDADIEIIENDLPKENGKSFSPEEVTHKIDDDDDVITLDSPVKKVKTSTNNATPPEPTRRSARNLNKKSRKSYAQKEINDVSEDESDIEEILPEDPLAVADPLAMPPEKTYPPKKSSSNTPTSTIVVKDTKRLVEIASKSNPSNTGKKEPTLVIIDTNSILSGRGPIPINQKPTISQSYPVLPMALPAQGVYPPNMRATITPIPISSATHSQTKTLPSLPAVQVSQVHPPALPQPTSSTTTSQSPAQQSQSQQSQAPILPSLTDDMFVVEAPSFIVPYVYEKPPVKDLKEFVDNFAKEIREQREAEEKEQKEREEREGINKDDDKSDEEKMDVDKNDDEKKVEIKTEKEDKKDPLENTEEPTSSSTRSNKPYSYFDSPLGKFFIDIGHNLVQEYVQTDLLKQQKRKREREGGKNIETNKTISSLIKNLEYTKENNEPYHMPIKKCEFCSFKTESALAMSFHLETPHMKNFIYRCNFCPYEVRSPHDILFHMEAEHMIRGRLERAPAFHQCPNCPFEDNQKGKLSRHLVACTKKFKPDRNLEPPIEWEPPAKIPRMPRMKQSNLTSTAAMYQAMAKSTQYQLMQKMQNAQSALNRGRGRPSLTQIKQPPIMRTPTSMIYKSSMSGGSVLLPTNYQLSGNQLYQVVGGQEMGGRIGTGAPMTLLPNISSATSTLTIQQQSPQQNKSKPMHQPSISITPLPRNTASSTPQSSPAAAASSKPGDSNSKNSFVICEICDGYIKDLEQLRNHMQWIHKVKIHPKMIYNRPPLNCQKCQFRFFTDQGLERHLLGSHGLVTSSMQEAANKSKDSGRCPVCGRVYQWKLLNHVARDHNMTLKPAHLSYKCTVCTATFGMYKQFENHVYSAHSVVAKRVMDKKTTNSPQTSSSSNSSNSMKNNDSLLKPLKINDEITIIPQLPKSSSSTASTSKEDSSTTKNSISVTTTPSTSKNELTRAERLARRKTTSGVDN